MATLARILAVLAVVSAASAFLRRPQWLKETRPEMWMSSPQLARWQGYNLETHKFYTTDGYEIVLHHITSSKNGTKGDIPILIGHGLASSDEQWYVRGPTALVYMLAEHGYDMWTANYRGSFYSRRHKTLNIKDHDFWDFSWHENGVMDHAESIDYILKATGKEKLIVVGHSMSSTAQVVLLSEKPEYNDKILGQVLLAPVIISKNPTGFLALSTKMILDIPGLKQSGQENVENNLFSGFDKPFPQSCFPNYGGYKPQILPFCKRIVEFVLGKIHTPLDIYQLQLIMHHYPAGASIRQLRHFSQNIISGVFSHYDYGKNRNRDLYGQDDPPAYNLTNVRIPTYIMYALGDGNVNWKDVEEFATLLNPGVLKKLHRLPHKDYCHIDFLIAIDAKELVYDNILKYLAEIKNGSYDN